jgi:glycosyltransferase involved in cell wall biosynthesis
LTLRIGIFHPYFADGGIERTTLLLAEEFARRGHEVDVVTIRPSGPFLERFGGLVTLTDLGARRVLTSVPRLAGYLRRRKPDLFISYQGYANIAAAWAHCIARSRSKLVLSERVDPLAQPGSGSRLRHWLIRRAYRRAHVVAANSQGTARSLAEFLEIPSGRVAVIYNSTIGNNLDELAKEPPSHPWLEDEGPPVVLGAGRLTRQKDFATLLRAFALVRQDSQARLVILGEGEERKALEALAMDLGIAEDVALPGFTVNPYAAIARAAVFVLSSRWEGLSNVLIEAQAVGTPVVATDCPSGPREVLLDGEAGLLVPVGGPEAMAEAVRRVLTQPGLAAMITGRARQGLGRFSSGPCAERYLELAGLT